MKKPILKHFGNSAPLILKAAASIGLVVWLFTRIDTAALLSAFSGVPPVMLLWALTLYLAATAVGALKWHRLLRGFDFRLLFKTMFVAQYYALLIPGQLGGEIIKVHKLNQFRHHPEDIISSILFDRITGWGALLLAGLVTLAVSRAGQAPWLANHFILAIGLLVAALWLVQSEVIQKWLNRLSRMHPRIEIIIKPIGKYLAGIPAACRRYMQTPRLLLETVILGLVYHLMGAAIFLVLCRSYGIGVAFTDLCWIFAALSLLLLLPITAGGIGLRESGLVVMLGWLSVPPEKAMAVSLSFFACQLIGAAIGAALDWQPIDRARRRCGQPGAICEPVRIDTE